MNDVYKNKFNKSIENSKFLLLNKIDQDYIKKISFEYKFSFSQIQELINFSIDFNMWNEKSIKDIFKDEYSSRKDAFNHIRNIWDYLKKRPNDYSSFDKNMYKNDRKISFHTKIKDSISLGSCPVASTNTRCCNLMTLDAVESCGFDCSYCSIQSFYKQDKITFDSNFATKLSKLKLDPNKSYHIGTGQSSDSLMWGNKEGVLDALFEFARLNINVILEFKTKSNNIRYFLENDVPSNIICTWSLNTPTIIKNEEHLSASLDQRLKSARLLSNKGVLVGFHFHPIVVYKDYLKDYKEVFNRVLNMFTYKEVVLISFGTLTFIKPVINMIRKRDFKSKILQMPFENANGKQSYSLDLKEEMFKFAYDSFKPWHDDVYFYLCMEDQSLWKKVFGYEYSSNEEMENAMKNSYNSKIEHLSKSIVGC
jgi:spore photoproduct lyase